MALTAAMQLSTNACVAGQTPVPVATLVVANAQAFPVVVTAVEVYFTNPLGQTLLPVAYPVVPPIGPGQPTTVAAGGSTTLGPMAMAFGSAGNANSFTMVPPSSLPQNPQGCLPPQRHIHVHARVYGSDGSINEAAPASMLVSYTDAPPLGFQGGFAQFAAPNNACLLAVI